MNKLKWGILMVILKVMVMVEGLDPHKLYSEGSCGRIRSHPASNFNRDAVVGMRYVMGGSKYHLLRQAEPHPLFLSIRDEAFDTTFCMEQNVTNFRGSSVGTVIGFGRALASFDIRSPSDSGSGVLFEAVPRNWFPKWDVLRETVTLTDNQNFAFFVSCWTGSDEVGWGVVTTTPTLSADTRRLVEEHAKSLGFDPENFVFLDHDHCQNEIGQSLESEKRISGNRNQVRISGSESDGGDLRQGLELETRRIKSERSQAQVSKSEEPEYERVYEREALQGRAQDYLREPRPRQENRRQSPSITTSKPSISYILDLKDLDIVRGTRKPRRKVEGGIRSLSDPGRGLNLRNLEFTNGQEIEDFIKDIEDTLGSKEVAKKTERLDLRKASGSGSSSEEQVDLDRNRSFGRRTEQRSGARKEREQRRKEWREREERQNEQSEQLQEVEREKDQDLKGTGGSNKAEGHGWSKV